MSLFYKNKNAQKTEYLCSTFEQNIFFMSVLVRVYFYIINLYIMYFSITSLFIMRRI